MCANHDNGVDAGITIAESLIFLPPFGGTL
jgi:hypothetical protein